MNRARKKAEDIVRVTAPQAIESDVVSVPKSAQWKEARVEDLRGRLIVQRHHGIPGLPISYKLKGHDWTYKVFCGMANRYEHRITRDGG